MIVRLGYVAMSMQVSNASPSKTMTAASFDKLNNRAAAVRKLERIAIENIHNTLRLLKHNRAHDIELYRCSSKLIPLRGHEMLNDWNPMVVLAEAFAELGSYAIKNAMRLSFHPDHFTVLSTPRADVLASSLKDLDSHVTMLEAMGLDESAKCNIHMGGMYGDKKIASQRFIDRFKALPERIRNRMTLENDDKTFTASETLEVCEVTHTPMVLDIHHHEVNHEEEIADSAVLWPRILQTWKGQTEQGTQLELPPKIHVSSPKSEKDTRSHADFIDPGPLLTFLRSIAPLTPRVDVMIEAKKKDDALFQLMKEISEEPELEVLNQASFKL
ncbi:UV DNA damage repair endonuclease UvsE [Paenibacillus sp. FSL H7-0331]|uniref:UV DNA damage repair endonuclease UvsE n=1 Tax=Paenibacillus sp. FSL H7-0331 TaxID=1920421 RepID=UPI00096DE095|nr:UV DNA damage repair endonuclease UvsE [Paenibacillus sp. FSL H7-0331]OMF16161.1 UV damage endonuclease UvsE [Paenibacillus sp. FSL H7-0331]